MNYYGKHPQEKAVQTLIHDTNNSLLKLHITVNNISEYIFDEAPKSMQDQIPDDIKTAISALKIQQQNLKKAIDAYLIEFKKFPTPIEC